MDEFFLDNGFRYNDTTDEWERNTIDGKLLLWLKPGSSSICVLSYEDKESYIHELRRGNKDDVLAEIRAHERDIKLTELLQ